MIHYILERKDIMEYDRIMVIISNRNSNPRRGLGDYRKLLMHLIVL